MLNVADIVFAVGAHRCFPVCLIYMFASVHKYFYCMCVLSFAHMYYIQEKPSRGMNALIPSPTIPCHPLSPPLESLWKPPLLSFHSFPFATHYLSSCHPLPIFFYSLSSSLIFSYPSLFPLLPSSPFPLSPSPWLHSYPLLFSPTLPSFLLLPTEAFFPSSRSPSSRPPPIVLPPIVPLNLLRFSPCYLLSLSTPSPLLSISQSPLSPLLSIPPFPPPLSQNLICGMELIPDIGGLSNETK